MQWHTTALDPQHTPLGHGPPPDPDVEPVEPPRETNSDLFVRQLSQAATDQDSQELRSQAANRSQPSLPDPQLRAPYLFVPWSTVAKRVGFPYVQAAPLPNLHAGVMHAVGLLPEDQQQEFHSRSSRHPRLHRLQFCEPAGMGALFVQGRRVVAEGLMDGTQGEP